MSVEQDPIRWFRTASPYIYAHRNKTFVVSLDQDALRPSAFVSIARDLTLLHALGVRLVVVHANAGAQTTSQMHDAKRGVDEGTHTATFRNLRSQTDQAT